MPTDSHETQRPKLKDVARAAGVSPTTVSHVLTGNRPVAEVTRDRVKRAIAELAYRPNAYARTLRTKKSLTTALLIPSITDPYYPPLARGLQDVLMPTGYHLFVCNTDGSREREKELLRDVVQRGVDGIVMEAYPLRPRAARELLPSTVPLVSLDTAVRPRQGDVVIVDEAAASFDVGRHLLQLGHKRMACIAGPGRRHEGFLAAVSAAGGEIPPELVVVSDWTRAGGAAAMEFVLSSRRRPTAVFAANDLMALGALETLQRHGISVPDELSVVGFDDIDALAFVRPALTTVQNPAYEMGVAAGEMLLKRFAGLDEKPQRRTLRCTLVVRESSGPVNSSGIRRPKSGSQTIAKRVGG